MLTALPEAAETTLATLTALAVVLWGAGVGWYFGRARVDEATRLARWGARAGRTITAGARLLRNQPPTDQEES